APATRRRVIYPLSPLPPQMHDDDYLEQDETDPEDEEPFFLDEEEEETAMEIYRDEEEDDESASAWEEPQFASVPRMPATGTASPMQPARMDSAPVYDQQIIEHASPIPASAPGKYPDAIQHSRYGRILPFSAAPSAGALPHLTSTLSNHVPLPRSVSARPASESSAPGQPVGPANQPGASQRTVPTQPGGPMQQARPADQ